jgi:hypothetical protein
MEKHTVQYARRRGACGSLPRVCVVLCALGALLLVQGCAEDVTVIRYDPFLARLPGAEGGEPPVGKRVQTESDPHDVPKEELIVKNPDGSVTLVARVTRQLIAHLARVMEEEDEDLLYDQLISKKTKAHFMAEGKDPKQEVKNYFAENRDDIYSLLARMPAGERTPGVMLSKIAPSHFKLTITGTAARGTRLTELWVIMENGNWKLWWFA